MAKAHTQRAHAKLSPSSGERWSNCPGSPRMSKDIPNKTSVYADEGTAAHTLGEKCLRNNVDAIDFLGGHVNIKAGTVGRDEQNGLGIFGIDDEMAEGVQAYLDECRQYMGEGWEWEVEARLDLTHIDGLEFGTGDFIAYSAAKKRLVIRDLKYGKGKVVEVVERHSGEVKINTQLGIYAEGTAKRFHNRGLDHVDLGIVQPRAPHPQGPVRNVIIDVLDLVEFRFQLADWAKATLAPDAPLCPGDWCRFCPAAPTCPALRDFSLKAAEMEFADAPPVATGMTPAEKGVLLAKAEVIEGWVKRVKQAAHEDALEGNGPLGWKLVESTSHRKFKDDVDEEILALNLRLATADLMTEPKLKSPAAVEKLIGAKRKGEIADYVFKPRGKVILAPDSDPRPPVKADAESEFA